jgi:hypothetical protein
MASTYTPQRAVNLVQNFVHGIPLSTVQADVCDEINSLIWTFYPWPWTISTLTPVSLVDGQQDYVLTNTDILRILKVRLTRTDCTPNEARELALLDNLSPELTRKAGIETMKAAGFFNSTNTLRLDQAASISTGQTVQINGEYQTLPTRITDQTMTTAFSFPDWMYYVFVDGLKWKIYQLSDDPRAGTMRFSKNGTMTRVADGQLGLFMESLLNSARAIDLSRGDDFEWPETPLGTGTATFPGLFGL